MLYWNGMGALALAVLLLPGCGRRSDPPAGSGATSAAVAEPPASSSAAALSSASASAVASAPGTRGAASAGPTAAAPSRTRGLVGRYLPGSCREGRIYLDVAGLVALAGPDAAAAREALLRSIDAGGQARRALDGLAGAGLDPLRDLREVGICARGGDDVLLVADVALGHLRGDLGDLLAKIAPPDGGRVVRRREGALEYVALESEAGVLARVAPSVVVASRTVAALRQAAAGAGTGFADATRHLVLIELTPRPEEATRLTVSDAGERLVVTGRFTPPPAPSAGGRMDPGVLLGQTRAQIDAAARRLEGSPFAALAADLRAVELGVVGGAVEARLTLPEARLRALVSELGRPSSVKPPTARP